MEKLRLLDTARAGRPGEELERKLHRTIVGQDEAIHNIVRAYQCYLTGLAAAGRPIANLLFLGPTGTGKTRVVEATAEALLGNPRAVLKIDAPNFSTAMKSPNSSGRLRDISGIVRHTRC
jgi:ATP-dependent Clp protease ATP-binding subunit ClpB